MKKFSKNYLYYHLVADIFITLVFSLAFSDSLFLEDAEGFARLDMRVVPFFVIGILVVYCALIVYRVLYLRTASYTLTDGEIRVSRGVLFRKNSIVDYKKMHAINKKQNIVQRLFGLAVLTVDSGSANTAGTAEILIYESAAEVDRLLVLLKAKKNGEAAEAEGALAEEVLTTENGDLVFTSGKKIAYTLLNIASAAFTLLYSAFIALFVYLCLVPALADLLAGGAFVVLIPALLVSLILLVVFSLISFFASILQSFIGYHNFRIAKNYSDLEISYGLLTRHTNTFGLDRIQGFIVHQNLIQRLFGFAMLKLEVIGYREGGDENSNNTVATVGILLPLCNVREVDDILASILPSYVPLKKESKAKRYFPFISWSLVYIAAIFALISLLTLSMMHLLGAPARSLSIVRILLPAFFVIAAGIKMIGALFAYKTAGLAISDDRITVYGGGFQKRVTTLLRRSLVAVEDVTTPLRARAGIYTLILHLRTNAETNEVKVEMLNKEDAERLREILPD